MILNRLDLFRYSVPLEPALRLKGALLTKRDGLLVRVQSAAQTDCPGSARTMAAPGKWSELPAHTRSSLQAARGGRVELVAKHAQFEQARAEVEDSFKSDHVILMEAEKFARGNVVVGGLRRHGAVR